MKKVCIHPAQRPFNWMSQGEPMMWSPRRDGGPTGHAKQALKKEWNEKIHGWVNKALEKGKNSGDSQLLSLGYKQPAVIRENAVLAQGKTKETKSSICMIN